MYERMTLSQILLDYDDAMYYRLLTNPFGSGDGEPGASAPSRDAMNVTSSSIDEIASKHPIHRVSSSLADLDPRVRDMYQNLN